MLKELKVIHEYQADKFAMNYTGREEYVKTLVYSTLTYHGLNLASSFSDAPIVKRLKFMKMMKKKVNPFKSGSILVIVAITAAMFACDDEIDAEINKIADQSTEQLVVDNPEVKLELEKLQAVNPDAEYAVIQTKYENKESLDMMKEIDPKQIEHVFINKTKYDKSITIILRKDSKLFEKTVENATKSKGEDDVFTVVEQTPQFPGGMEAFYEYLSTNLKYPEEAIKNQAEGKVYVEFVVEKNGDLSNVRAVKGVGYGCDEEAVRVVKNAPAFEPGEQRGRKVRVKMVLPIMFKQPVKNG